MKNLIHSIVFLITFLSSMTGAEEEVVYAQVGQTVVLKPIQANGAVQKYMYWKLGETDLAYRNAVVGWVVTEKWRDRVSVTDSTLTISKLSEDDFGTLTLSVLQNQQTGDKREIYTCHLFRITVNMASLSPVLASESLTLDCNTDYLPRFGKPEIYWLNPQRTKMPVNRTVQKATSQDNGEWTCVVKSAKKESKATISVAVVDLYSSPHQFTSKSSPLQLPCSLPSHITWDQLKTRGIEEVQWQFSPNPPSGDRSNGQKQKLFSLSLDTLQWEPEHSLKTVRVADVTKGNLSLTKRQGKDGGDYECIVKFKGGVTLTRTVHVDVLRIFASPGTNLTSGQQLNLTCGTGSALPNDVKLKLFPLDKSSQSDHHHPSVTIPAVNTEHSGKWRCELWQGGKRVASEVITLKIDNKLSVWMLVIICSAVVIVLLLLVVVFILYRRKQQRMGHPRHQLCRCEHPKPKGFYKT